jgi:hypothetical protein
MRHSLHQLLIFGALVINVNCPLVSLSQAINASLMLIGAAVTIMNDIVTFRIMDPLSSLTLPFDYYTTLIGGAPLCGLISNHHQYTNTNDSEEGRWHCMPYNIPQSTERDVVRKDVLISIDEPIQWMSFALCEGTALRVMIFSSHSIPHRVCFCQCQ